MGHAICLRCGAKRKNVPIIQRLNDELDAQGGKTPPRAFFKSESNNRLLAFIRRHLADKIIYQSEFSQAWWDRAYQPTNLPSKMVYNGVIQNLCTRRARKPPAGHDRILLWKDT